VYVSPRLSVSARLSVNAASVSPLISVCDNLTRVCQFSVCVSPRLSVSAASVC
jgi:hypothetical protein